MELGVDETQRWLNTLFAKLGWKIAGFAYVTEKWHDVLGNGVYKLANDQYAMPGMAMMSARRKTGCECNLCLDDSPPCEFPSM
jgi:hypothetical protein